MTRKDVEKISNISSLWSSYSGTLKKNVKELKEINSIRGLRYFGPSKMSLINLVVHSFSIIAVFKLYVLLRSILMIIILFPLLIYNEFLFFLFVFFITVFNLLIFIVSKRENYGDMTNSQNNLKNTTYITH